MVSRLRKALNQQERCKRTADNKCDNENKVCKPRTGKTLPYPKSLLKHHQVSWNMRPLYNGKHTNPICHTSDSIIPSSTKIRNKHNEWRMMREHYLWIRVFDKHDRLLFDHTNSQSMKASQMIYLGTTLVKHLNVLSRTNELKAQEALGTLEGTIIAQITPPPGGQVQFHSWNLRNYDDYSDMSTPEAIAIIRQAEDNTFKGEIVDDLIGTTFQLQ